MCLNLHPQTNETHKSYGAKLLREQTCLVLTNMPTVWAALSYQDLHRPVRVRVRVRVGGGMRYLRTEKLRSFHLRPFIVLTITKRAHYKAERETTCSVNVLKLVSPNQPDLQQLWGQSTSKPNALSLRERTPQVGYFCAPRHRPSLPES